MAALHRHRRPAGSTHAPGVLWTLLLGWLLAIGTARAAPLLLDARATAVDLSPHVEFLEDRDGELGYIDAVRSDAFRPLPGGSHANFGYTSSAYWLRFPVMLASGAPRDWLLEIGYFSLDHVEVHAPGAPPQVSGNTLPFHARPLDHRHFVFPLSFATGGEPEYVYVHVRSTGSMTLPLTLWQPRAFIAGTERSYTLLALYYGALLALLLYNLLLYFSLRDRNYLLYVMFVASMALAQLSMNGLGNQFVWTGWAGWNGVASDISASAAGLFGLWFTRGFLDTVRTMPWLDRALRAVMAVFALNILYIAVRVGLSDATGVTIQSGAVVLSLNALLACFLAIVAGVLALFRGHTPARFFLGAWGLLLAGATIASLRNFGWVPTTTLTAHALQVGSALEMLLLSFALADRIHVERRGRESAQAEALAAKQALVDALTESERTLEARVAQRTAELQTANEKLRDSEIMLRNMAQHDSLTGLANRALLEDRLEQAVLKARRFNQQLAVLLLDLDNFKPVNDRFGHAAGDEVLKEVARRVRGAVRASDTVARVGGDEFVIVLEGVNASHHAGQVGETLVNMVSRPISLDGHDLTVSASIGIAMYPQHGITPRELISNADAAMYAAKADGRNCYRAFAR